MKPLESMSDAEFCQECADAAAHLATQILTILRQTAMLARGADGVDIRPLLEFTIRPIMESLGDVLSNMDAVTEKDEWTDPIYKELHRRFPRG